MGTVITVATVPQLQQFELIKTFVVFPLRILHASVGRCWLDCGSKDHVDELASCLATFMVTHYYIVVGYYHCVLLAHGESHDTHVTKHPS